MCLGGVGVDEGEVEMKRGREERTRVSRRIPLPQATAHFGAAFLPLLLSSAACVGACTIFTLTLAPRYISPAEVALMLLLENILGPAWVAVAGFEVPDGWTIGGGCLLVAVLGLNQAAAVREGRRKRRTSSAAVNEERRSQSASAKATRTDADAEVARPDADEDVASEHCKF